MASVSSNGEDKLNTELNLVPFIDLLSSLVLFLLLTTVWMQVGSMTVSADSKGPGSSSPSTAATLFVHLNAQGFELTLKGNIKTTQKLPKIIARVQGQYDQDKLMTTLKTVFTEKLPVSVAVSAEDNVSYAFVINTIDSMKLLGFPAVAMSTD